MDDIDLVQFDGDSEEGKVFLSYSRKDREGAQRISDVLQERHFGVFKDTDDILPTEQWKDRLEQLIAEADTIVFLLSPNSVESEVCAWEVEYATSLNKRIAPIVIEEVDTAKIPPLLARLNFIFCTPRDRFEDAVDSLVSALGTDIEWIREHTRLAGLAQRWHAGNRPQRLLLRGQDIAAAEDWRDERPPEAPDVTTLHSAFINESRKAATRRQRQIVGMSLAGVVIAFGLAGVAYWQKELADKQRNEALRQQSRFLSDLSQQKSQMGDHVSGALLAIEALPSAGNPKPYVPVAFAALNEAIAGMGEPALLVHKSPIRDAIWLPGKAGIITTESSGGGHFWSDDGKETGRFGPAIELKIGDTINTPNGLFALAGDAAGYVYAINPSDNQADRTRITEWAVHDIAVNSDGKKIAVGNAGGEVLLMTSMQSKPLILKGHESVSQGLLSPSSAVHFVEFSPNGKDVASMGADGTVRFWDANDGKALGKIGPKTGYPEVLQYYPDGQRLLFSFGDSAFIWPATPPARTPPASEIEPIELTHEKALRAVKMSPDGSRIAAGDFFGGIKLWDGADGTEIAKLRHHSSDIEVIAFSPDGRLVASADRTGAIAVWRSFDGELVTRFAGHSTVYKITFSPDGGRLLSWGHEKAARIWSIDRAAEWRRRPANGEIVEIDVARQTSETVALLKNGDVSHYDANGKETVVVRDHDAKNVSISADGSLIAIVHKDDRVTFFDSSGLRVGQLDAGHLSKSIVQVAIGEHGKWVAIGTSDSKVTIVDRNAQPLAAFQAHKPGEYEGEFYAIEGMKSIDSGAFLLTWAKDGSAAIWHPDGSLLRRYSITWNQELVDYGEDKSVWSVAYNADGGEMILGGVYGAQIFDSSGNITGTIYKRGVIRAAGFLPDGRVIIATYGHLAIYEKTGVLVRVIENKIDYADSTRFSQNGRFVLASNGGTARLLSIEGDFLSTWSTVYSSGAFARSSVGSDRIIILERGTLISRGFFHDLDGALSSARVMVQRCFNNAERHKYFLSEANPNWCHNKWQAE